MLRTFLEAVSLPFYLWSFSQIGESHCSPRPSLKLGTPRTSKARRLFSFSESFQRQGEHSEGVKVHGASQTTWSRKQRPEPAGLGVPLFEPHPHAAWLSSRTPHGSVPCTAFIRLADSQAFSILYSMCSNEEKDRTSPFVP